jgi:hypothetical protein
MSIVGDALEQAAGGRLETAERAFLQPICHRVSQQIRLHPRRRFGPVYRLPTHFQFGVVEGTEPSDFGDKFLAISL